MSTSAENLKVQVKDLMVRLVVQPAVIFDEEGIDKELDEVCDSEEV